MNGIKLCILALVVSGGKKDAVFPAQSFQKHSGIPPAQQSHVSWVPFQPQGGCIFGPRGPNKWDPINFTHKFHCDPIWASSSWLNLGN